MCQESDGIGEILLLNELLEERWRIEFRGQECKTLRRKLRSSTHNAKRLACFQHLHGAAVN
jgi:hypothetical protein